MLDDQLAAIAEQPGQRHLAIRPLEKPVVQRDEVALLEERVERPPPDAERSFLVLGKPRRFVIKNVGGEAFQDPRRGPGRAGDSPPDWR